MWRRALVVVIAVWVGVPPAAAWAAPAADTMVVALLQDVDSLNPFLGAQASATMMFRLMYDYLTDYDPADNRPVPGLATAWTTSPDGLTWTFRLRRGVRWSDGQELTATDVAFTYRTVMQHPTSANAALLHDVDSVSSPDAGTVVIRTRVPVPTMLSLDIPIVPEHVWRGRDPLSGMAVSGAAVGSGPFRLESAGQPASYTFTRNLRHWRTVPRVQHLVFRSFTSTDAAVQALRRGEVDLVPNLTPAQYGALAGPGGIGRNVARGSRLTELGFNVGAARADGGQIGDGHPALRDLRVRLAIDEAIDRNVLVARVLDGLGDPGEGYLPASYAPWGWRPGPGEGPSFDPAAANRLLDEAGYPRGPDGVRTMPDGGRALSFRLYVPTGRAHYQQSATYLSEWLRAVGIEVRAQLMSDADKATRVAAGRYDLFLGGWILDPDPDYLLSVQTCAARPDAAGNGTTDTFACDQRYDQLYAAQSRELDPSRRASLVQQAQQRLRETAPLEVLYYPAVLEAFRSDRFTGFVHRPAVHGSIAGPWSFVAVSPLQPASPPRTAQLAVTSALVAVVLALFTVVARRRRASRNLRP